MFGQLRKSRNAELDGESAEPLLNSSRENLVAEERVVFAIDDDDVLDHSGRSSPHSERQEHGVRFQEEVQVIGPPLKSTMHSRESGKYNAIPQRPNFET